MFFVLLGGYLILVVFSGKPRRGSRYLLCYLSGLSLALGFWVRQPVGLMLPVMFLAFGLLYLDRDIVNRRLVVGAFAYIGGMLSVSALIIAFLWYTNSLGDWWLQSIVGASRFPSGILNSGESFLENLYHRAFPSPNLIRGISSGSLWALLPVLNLAVFIVLLIRLSIFRSQSIESRNLFILSLLAAGMWHHYFPVPGAWQIYWGATPMIAVVITAFFRLAILLKLSTQVSTLVVLIITLSIFGSEIERRLTPIVDSKPLHPISIPTLEGMWASSRFATKVRFDGSPSEFEDELTKLGNVLRNLATLDPARPLVTLTEDLFLASTLNELNPGPVTVWWDWVRSLYPNHKKEFRDFVREHAPIVEAKIKPWAGLDPINDSNLRVTLGIDSYEPLITTTYSDSGPAVLLLPPDLLRQYKMTYGISQILSAN